MASHGVFSFFLKPISVFKYAQAGLPLPLSSASRPAAATAASAHTAAAPVLASPDIPELFHDGFLLCRHDALLMNAACASHFSTLTPLIRLAEILESIALPSIVIRPRTDAAKLANVDKALSVFQVISGVFTFKLL
jgi:hypothetical protein